MVSKLYFIHTDKNSSLCHENMRGSHVFHDFLTLIKGNHPLETTIAPRETIYNSVCIAARNVYTTTMVMYYKTVDSCVMLLKLMKSDKQGQQCNLFPSFNLTQGNT